MLSEPSSTGLTPPDASGSCSFVCSASPVVKTSIAMFIAANLLLKERSGTSTISAVWFPCHPRGAAAAVGEALGVEAASSEDKTWKALNSCVPRF